MSEKFYSSITQDKANTEISVNYVEENNDSSPCTITIKTPASDILLMDGTSHEEINFTVYGSMEMEEIMKAFKFISSQYKHWLDKKNN